VARPLTPKLSLDLIADEAIALIDSGKPFGVNALARRLAVTPSSLYSHVSGRDEIIELVRRRLVPGIADHPDLSKPWAEAVTESLRAQRRAYAAHPHAILLFVQLTITSPEVVGYYARLADLLVGAGFAESEVLPIIEMLDALAIGFGIDQASPNDIWQVADAPSTFGRLLATAERGSVRSDHAFELSLTLLIDALQRRLEGTGG
jgi:hypothetical protein